MIKINIINTDNIKTTYMALNSLNSLNSLNLHLLPADILDLIFRDLIKKGYRHVYDIHPKINRELKLVIPFNTLKNCTSFKNILYKEIQYKSGLISYYCFNYKWFRNTLNCMHHIDINHVDIFNYTYICKKIKTKQINTIQIKKHNLLEHLEWYIKLYDTHRCNDIVDVSDFETFVKIIHKVKNHQFDFKNDYSKSLISRRLHSSTTTLNEIEYYHNNGVIITDYTFHTSDGILALLIKL